MKLHTRQEIVDGVKGEIKYEISWKREIIGSQVYLHNFTLTEPEAKELYELLKERFEKLSTSTD